MRFTLHSLYMPPNWTSKFNLTLDRSQRMSFIKHFTTSGGRIHPISRTLQICRRNVTGTTLTFAAPSSFPSEARESKFTESWLPSGMKVCTYETGSPLVTLSLVVFAGSRNDDPAHLGTAHVLQRTLIRVRLFHWMPIHNICS